MLKVMSLIISPACPFTKEKKTQKAKKAMLLKSALLKDFCGNL
jgi:hypothetical protein